MNELEQWNFQNQKLNLEDGILKNCLKIEFRNWKIEELFRDGISEN